MDFQVERPVFEGFGNTLTARFSASEVASGPAEIITSSTARKPWLARLMAWKPTKSVPVAGVMSTTAGVLVLLASR